MYVILVILFFFFLIIRHTINHIGNYLEGFCSDTGSSKDACKEIENNKNTASIKYSEKIITESKSSIEKLLINISKSIDTTKKAIQENTKNMLLNISNNNKIKKAITPDK